MTMLLYLSSALLLLMAVQPFQGRDSNIDKEVEEILLELLEMELEDYRARSKAKDVNTWLNHTSTDLRLWQNKEANADWNYVTDITDYNRKQMSEIETRYAEWYPRVQQHAEYLRRENKNLDFTTDRQLRLLSKYAKPSNPEDVRRLKDIQGRMSGIYSTARACHDRETCLEIEPGLQNLLEKSRDPAVLEWAWKTWRNVTGPEIKPLYLEFVDLLNKGAREHNLDNYQKYGNYGAYWRDEQFDETPDLEEMCENLWLTVKPMYEQLHAYVRRKLRERYSESFVGTKGAIPAHLLGNMWAQNWQMIPDIVFPPATNEDTDISSGAEENLKKNYDVKGLFRLAEEFYTSIGLFPMTDIFWKKSMFTKPKDRPVTCHASASDLYAKDDFRIKMCTEVNMDYLYTVHHEMGHIQYFMAYAHQPTIYRTGANAAFHEAVGDTMTLSVVSRKHLNTIGLIKQESTSKGDDIADLLNIALNKVAFLPYGYLIDKWRWGVFSGKIPRDRLNEEYWKLRLKYQGIVSPVPRSEADFDPAAKYHVPANSPYMVYFVSYIVQFQFYKTLCDVSGHTGPLHTCDFYKSKEAGEKLLNMLKLGQSVPWKDALEQFTGSRNLSAEPLMEYFKPLMDWLKEQNEGEALGWADAEISWQQ